MKNENKKPLTKKKKTVFIILVSSIVALIAAGVAIVLAVILKPDLSLEEADKIISADIKSTIEEIKNEGNAFVADILDTSSVSVLSISKEDDNKVSVQSVVKSKDAYNAIKKVQETYGETETTYDEIVADFSQELNQADYIENEVEIILIKENDEWTVDYSYDLIDSLMGGYLKYGYENMEKDIEE